MITSSDPAVTSGETVYDVTPESDSGGSSDPAESTSSTSSTTTQQGGEHTYDIDPSVDDDPALDYSSVNDPRQTADDTTGTAGGEVEDSSVETGYVGLINPDQQKREEEVDAIADLTHTTDADGDRVHTTDTIPDDPRYIFFDDGDPSTDSGGHTEPDWSGDGNPGGRATERVPNVELPDVPAPTVEIGGGWMAAAAIGAAALLVGGSAAAFGGGS